MTSFFPHSQLVVILSFQILPISIDTLLLAIKEQSGVHANVTVFSNYLEFDSEGVVSGFSHPMINSTNKGSLHAHFSGLSPDIKVKKWSPIG